MAILRNKEVKEMSVEEAQARADEIYNNYSKMKSQIRSGGAPENSGKMKEMRRAIARLKTHIGSQDKVPVKADTAPKKKADKAEKKPEVKKPVKKAVAPKKTKKA